MTAANSPPATPAQTAIVMHPTGKTRAILLLTASLVASLVFLLYRFLQPPTPAPLPVPNGYDKFVAAGQMISRDVPDWKTASTTELRQFVSSNQSALDLGRSGLTNQCRVPVQYTTTWINDTASQLPTIKRLAQGYLVEGKLAELEKRPTAAAASYLSAITLGIKAAHGGVMINALVATACEGVGVSGLAQEVESLDAATSRSVMNALEKLKTQREPSARILEEESKWAGAQRRSFQGIAIFLREMVANLSDRTTETMERLFLDKYESGLQWELQLQAKLAAHAFTLEKGRPPTNWNEVVPAYLPAIPSAPFRPDDTNRLTL